MPKNKKISKINGIVKVSKIARKHRIGTRKSGVSANSMTENKLKDVISNTDITRDRDNAIYVLKQRGIM